MTARDEQETTVTAMRDDTTVSVYTSNSVHLRKLKNLASTRDFVRLVREVGDGAEFVIDAPFFHLFSAIRGKRTLSDEAKAAGAARLAASRELRRSSAVDEALRERDV
ncbi:hypothetical protein [Microbacterium sp.]|uniref:hypothetical protein n=1 Tax=Microbacterium sp. TaxID=51671 RepID=UPI00356849CE